MSAAARAVCGLLVLVLGIATAELPAPELRIPADLISTIPANEEPAPPTEAETEAALAACYCEKRATTGRPCDSKNEEQRKGVIEMASKGCEEELRGMPENDFKQQALHDCVCRVRSSAGFDCASAEEEKAQAKQDEDFKEACKEQQARAAAEPLKAAAEQRECLCSWAKKVSPTLCDEGESLARVRAEIAGAEAQCASEKKGRGKCICKQREGGSTPCLSKEEWRKLQGAVLAQHATCGKANRRRRDAPASRRDEQKALEQDLAEQDTPAVEAPAEQAGEAEDEESGTEEAGSAQADATATADAKEL